MARAVTWAESAVDDLEKAAEFIARDSPSYAGDLVREAFAAARSLQSLAERGRMVPEAGSPHIRELFIKRSFRLIYKVSPGKVHVLTLVHGARDLTALWSEIEQR